MLSDPSKPRVSVLTVCMNRQLHLRQTARYLAASSQHDEHLILDWSSATPLRRSELPADPRIRLHRVEGEDDWNLCRAYNFAASIASGSILLKLDADCWLASSFCVDTLLGKSPVWLGSGSGGTAGQWLMRRDAFDAVGGFNERMIGWGFDDKDLRARLVLQFGEQVKILPPDALQAIQHGDSVRVGRSSRRSSGSFAQHQTLASLRASRLNNRLVAAECPWGRSSSPTQYRCCSSRESDSVWCADAETIPQLPDHLGRSLRQKRRRAFWNVLLAIPDVAIEQLPAKLLPADCSGQWRIRWWHYLYWLTIRRLLMMPVVILGCLKGRGQLFR